MLFESDTQLLVRDQAALEQDVAQLLHRTTNASAAAGVPR